MARQRLVRRQIRVTEVQALCMNVVTAEPFNDTIVIPGHFKNEDKLIAEIRKSYDTEEKKFVQMIKAESLKQMYHMDEEAFLKNAELVPFEKIEPETKSENN